MYFDFTDPLLQTDRFEYYRRFRENDPIHWTPYGYWVLFRYDDMDALLRSPNASNNFPANRNWARVRGGPNSPVVRLASRMMVMQDGAAHKRFRRVFGKLLSRRMVDRFRVRIPQIVDHLLADTGNREIDVMSRLAFPLPVTVASELLGIPEPDRSRMLSWSVSISRVIDRSVAPRHLIEMNRIEPEFRALVYELVKEARDAEPVDTLISLMAHNRDDDDQPYTDDEIVSNVAALFQAGYETTTNLIGNGLLTLLQHPDALEQLRADPSLASTAVEELSRYTPSARYAARILTADTKVGDTVIPAGECVFMTFDSAGRDPERYPDPDRLDLGRAGVRSLAFSGGPHHCMGTTLAGVEIGTLFGELLRRYRTIELACDSPPYQNHFNLTALASLPVRLVP